MASRLLNSGMNRHRKLCPLLQFHHQNVSNAAALPCSYQEPELPRRAIHHRGIIWNGTLLRKTQQSPDQKSPNQRSPMKAKCLLYTDTSQKVMFIGRTTLPCSHTSCLFHVCESNTHMCFWSHSTENENWKKQRQQRTQRENGAELTPLQMIFVMSYTLHKKSPIAHLRNNKTLQHLLQQQWFQYVKIK